MGRSVDGQICYGVVVDDEELPWSDKKYDWDIEAWWLEVQGYEPPFELYGEDGEYLDGVQPSRDRIEEYFRAQREFIEGRPLPVCEVVYGSEEFPMFILAVPRTCMIAGRGFPEAFDPADLVVFPEERQALVDFCSTYGIEYDGEPRWWLSSSLG